MTSRYAELLNWLLIPQNEAAVASIVAGRAAIVPLELTPCVVGACGDGIGFSQLYARQVATCRLDKSPT